MKLYKVEVTEAKKSYYEVWAADKEEAQDLAEDQYFAGGGGNDTFLLDSDQSEDWQVTDIQEIDDDGKTSYEAF